MFRVMSMARNGWCPERSRAGCCREVARAAAFALATAACGGRFVLSSSAESDSDGAANPGEDAAAPEAPEGGRDAGASPPVGFLTACASYASVSGRVSCESCVARASCDAVWAQLSSQCGPAYLCGISHCLCTSPCDTSTLCSCLAGCLPIGESLCADLWANAMQCAASPCAGKC